jgi:hypothetical protein
MSMKSSSDTFRLVAQCLNQLRHRVLIADALLRVYLFSTAYDMTCCTSLHCSAHNIVVIYLVRSDR